MKKSFITDFVYIIAGSAILSIGLDMFIYPSNFSPGGVSGLAAVIHQFLPLTIGTLAFLINLPLLIAAWRVLGFKSLFKTIIATVFTSVFIDLFAVIFPTYDANPLMAAVLGGVFSGAGVGILFLRGISTGGTDLVSILLLRAMPNVPCGTLMLFADASVVLCNVLVFHDIEIALYSFVIIFVSSKVIDAIMDGANYAKVIYIVTEKGDELNRSLGKEFERGITLLPAVGGFTGDQKQMLVTVTRQNVLAQTLTMIKAIDPYAFTYVVNAAEVHGEGFMRYRADLDPGITEQN